MFVYSTVFMPSFFSNIDLKAANVNTNAVGGQWAAILFLGRNVPRGIMGLVVSYPVVCMTQ